MMMTKAMILPTVLIISLTGCLQTRQQISGGSPMGGSRAGAGEAPSAGTQRQKAQIDSRFFEIDRDFRQLYGKIEAIEGRVEQLGSQDNGSGATSEEAEEKIKALETRVQTLEEAILSLDKRLSSKNASFKSGARGSIAKNIKSDFQKGEAYLAQKDCVNAIESFDKYRKRYPKGRYYSIATYNMGECFRQLELPKDAKAFYREVLDRYPETKVAKRAESRLSMVR